MVAAAAFPPFVALLLVGGIPDRRAGQRPDPAADQRARGAVAVPGDAVAGDAPHDAPDNRSGRCAPPATAPRHLGILRIIIAAVRRAITGRRRRIACAMSFDRALVSAFVPAAVGRVIGAGPASGPAALGIIAAVDVTIIRFARHAVGIAGIDAGIGRGGGAIVELRRRVAGKGHAAGQQNRPDGAQKQNRPHAQLPVPPSPRLPRSTRRQAIG